MRRLRAAQAAARAGREPNQPFALPNAVWITNRAKWHHARSGIARFLRSVPAKHRAAVVREVVARYDTGHVVGQPLGVQGILEAVDAEDA